MKRGRWMLAAAAVCVVTMAWAADSAKSLYNKGRDAEARQNYEQAFEFYKQAYDQKPRELKYRTAFTRMRFMAASTRIKNGQALRQQGKLDEALAEFQKAYEIDPSSFLAQQEIKATQQAIEKSKNPPPAAGPGPGSSLEKRIAEAAGPVELAQISETPIILQLTEDSKVIYETVGKLAGINVLFDPEYTPRRIKIALNGVTLNQALDILALESKTFWRPVTPNTIFVAADTPAKRKELEQSVIKTFYLSNLSQPTEIQDVVNAVRTILEVNRVQQLPSQGAIVVRGTPDQVALAEKLIDDIDKARPEVVVDVVVMQVSLDNLRHLGVQPPTSATVQLGGNIPNTTTTTGGTTGTTGSTTTTGTIPNTVTLNQIANLTASDFQVTIPGATANFLFDDSTTKIIQQPQIRALDGQKASLKIGERIPVATGSFQPGIGGVGINPLVNTQFQYIDVGVNIDVTPRVHADQEVSMKLALEISSVIGSQTIGGISQPIIGQRKIEHDIRLKDGEVNLVGGILEDSDFKEWTGMPGLGNIPLLRYLFATRNTERKTNEIVFALVPHIVRRQELSELNLKPVDVGTANAIDLRRMSKAEITPAATVAAAQSPTTAPSAPAPAATPASGAVIPAAAPANREATPPATAALRIDPPVVSQTVGSTFLVNVVLSGGQDVYAVPVQITYDPHTLGLVNISNGGLLSKDGQAVALVHRDDPEGGTIQVSASRPPGTPGISADGVVYTLTFVAKAQGDSTLAISRPTLRNAQMQSLPVRSVGATISVH